MLPPLLTKSNHSSNGAAAELRAEGPSVLAACSAGAGGRTRRVLRRGPVQPGACARLNAKLRGAAVFCRVPL